MDCKEQDRESPKRAPPPFDWFQAIFHRLFALSVIPRAVLGIAILSVSNSTLAAIAYVQGSWAAPQTLQSTASVVLTSAQNAGDLNVVFIGWHTVSAQITSVVDTKGNIYTSALGPTVSSDNRIQYIYYAKNIAAAAANGNTVTVTMSAVVDNLDVRVAEYSGIDTTSPLNGAIGAAGDGISMSTGSLTTTNANDVLVASNYVSHSTLAAGAGFTQRMLTADQDILEDKIVTSTGNYSAAATQNDTGPWIIQMAAFKAAGGGGGDITPPTAPTNPSAAAASSTQINVSWTAATDNVGVTGYRVERCQGASCTNFAQVATPTGVTYNDTGLTASTTYRYQVRAIDAAGNLGPYSSIVGATTSTPLPAPTGLSVTASSNKEIDLAWNAVSGATGYIVERCSGVGCSTYSPLGASSPNLYLYNASLTASTSYSYRVRAVDSSGGQSAPSSVVTKVTLATAACD